MAMNLTRLETAVASVEAKIAELVTAVNSPADQAAVDNLADKLTNAVASATNPSPTH